MIVPLKPLSRLSIFAILLLTSFKLGNGLTSVVSLDDVENLATWDAFKTLGNLLQSKTLCFDVREGYDNGDENVPANADNIKSI